MKLKPHTLRALKTWAPPLFGILAMLLLGAWLEVARFFLFTHHLFWIVGIILFINPVAETFWPIEMHKGKTRPAPPRLSSKAQRRAQARKHMAQQKSAPASDTPAERLAHLRKQKEAVDQDIEKLTSKGKGRVK